MAHLRHVFRQCHSARHQSRQLQPCCKDGKVLVGREASMLSGMDEWKPLSRVCHAHEAYLLPSSCQALTAVFSLAACTSILDNYTLMRVQCEMPCADKSKSAPTRMFCAGPLCCLRLFVSYHGCFGFLAHAMQALGTFPPFDLLANPRTIMERTFFVLFFLAFGTLALGKPSCTARDEKCFQGSLFLQRETLSKISQMATEDISTKRNT